MTFSSLSFSFIFPLHICRSLQERKAPFRLMLRTQLFETWSARRMWWVPVWHSRQPTQSSMAKFSMSQYGTCKTICEITVGQSQ
jgi:hypothetical protein